MNELQGDPGAERDGHETPYTVGDMVELRSRLEAEDRLQLADEQLAGRGAEIVEFTPPAVRLDESTGEPVLPMIFIQGLGGDGKLPYHVKSLAETGQRQVIALNYKGQLVPERNERIQTEGGDVIPGVYQDRAEDLEMLVDALGLDRVEIAAQSVGVPTAVLFADARPRQVNRLVLIQPGGVDMMTPRQRKIASAREGLNYLPAVGKRKGLVKEQKPEGDQPKSEVGLRAKLKNVAQQRRDIMASNMREAIAGLNPSVQVAVTGDRHDDVYPADEVYASVSEMPNARFIATNWGRGKHGIGYSEEAIKGVNDVFLEMETGRRAGSW